MATLAELRNKIITSIHGRRLGFDANDQLTGPRGMLSPISAATSATTGTNLANHGTVTIDSTTGDSYVLDDPVEGCTVKIAVISTGGTQTVTPDNATILSSASSTGGSITMVGGSQASIELFGASTSLWVPISRYGSSATVHVNT